MNIDLKLLDARYGRDWPLPAPSDAGSAGVDLRSITSCVLHANSCHLLETGVAIHIADPNYAGFIYPRSGLGHKHGLILGNGTGVIDSSYTGEIKVSLWNRSDDSYQFEIGDRIAQLVIMPVARPVFRVVDTLRDTDRGAGGFGSTGAR